jgi:hypothetical protein
MVETDTDKANIQYIKMEFFRTPTQNCRKLQGLNKEIDRTEQRIHVVHFVKGMRFFVDTLAHACFHMGSSESSGRKWSFRYDGSRPVCSRNTAN